MTPRLNRGPSPPPWRRSRAPRPSGSPSGIAARHKVDGEWRELTYAEVERGDRRGRAGTDRARRQDRRSRGDPCRHPSGVDPGQLWHLRHGRGGRARLSDQFPEGMRLGARELRGGRGVLRERDQRAKIDKVRDELPELDTTIGIEAGAGELTLDELRERGRGRERSELTERRTRCSATTPTRSSTPRARPGPPRASCSPTATPCRSARWSRS